MRKVTLEISENAYKKLKNAGIIATMAPSHGLAELLMFKVLDALENNRDTVEIKAKEDK